MNERLEQLRKLLNELNANKRDYIAQRDNAEDMIEEINFRIDEVNDDIARTVKGEVAI